MVVLLHINYLKGIIKISQILTLLVVEELKNILWRHLKFLKTAGNENCVKTRFLEPVAWFLWVWLMIFECWGLATLKSSVWIRSRCGSWGCLHDWSMSLCSGAARALGGGRQRAWYRALLLLWLQGCCGVDLACIPMWGSSESSRVSATWQQFRQQKMQCRSCWLGRRGLVS